MKSYHYHNEENDLEETKKLKTTPCYCSTEIQLNLPSNVRNNTDRQTMIGLHVKLYPTLIKTIS